MRSATRCGPRSASCGAPRDDERDLLVSWMEAFAHEAGIVRADQAEVIVDTWFARGGLLVWDDGGAEGATGCRR